MLLSCFCSDKLWALAPRTKQRVTKYIWKWTDKCQCRPIWNRKKGRGNKRKKKEDYLSSLIGKRSEKCLKSLYCIFSCLGFDKKLTKISGKLSMMFLIFAGRPDQHSFSLQQIAKCLKQIKILSTTSTINTAWHWQSKLICCWQKDSSTCREESTCFDSGYGYNPIMWHGIMCSVVIFR